MEWDRATRASAILHGGVILWALFGDWLFTPSDMPEMKVTDVSMVSEDEFQAMMAAAPKAETAGDPPPATPPKSRPEPKPDPAPDPAQAPQDLPPELPASPDPQPIEAPPPVAPLASEAQPIPVPQTSVAPKPRPSDRVAAVPVDESVDASEMAETVTPETSDQAAPDAEVVQEQQDKASPQEASTQIVTEASETDTAAPQLAPTASRRPQSRPEAPGQAAQDQPAESSEQADAAPDPADAAETDDALAAALAEATATPDDSTGGQTDLPEGPRMSASEVEGLRLAVNKCWSVGTLSTEALNTIVRVRVELDETGKPMKDTFEMVGYEGGGEEAAKRVYEAGRRAVIRCAGQAGYDLPPEKYQDWRIVNIEFDPNGMRLR